MKIKKRVFIFFGSFILLFSCGQTSNHDNKVKYYIIVKTEMKNTSSIVNCFWRQMTEAVLSASKNQEFKLDSSYISKLNKSYQISTQVLTSSIDILTDIEEIDQNINLKEKTLSLLKITKQLQADALPSLIKSLSDGLDKMTNVQKESLNKFTLKAKELESTSAELTKLAHDFVEKYHITSEDEKRVEKSINEFLDKRGEVNLIKGGDEFQTTEARILNKEGLKQVKSNNLDGARIKFLEALKIESKNASILNNIGLVEKSAMDYNKAISYFQRSLIVSDSLYLNAATNLGLTYFENKNYSECIKISNYAILKSNDSIILGVAHLNLTLAFAETRQCENARKEYEKAKFFLKGSPISLEQLLSLKNKLDECK